MPRYKNFADNNTELVEDESFTIFIGPNTSVQLNHTVAAGLGADFFYQYFRSDDPVSRDARSGYVEYFPILFNMKQPYAPTDPAKWSDELDRGSDSRSGLSTGYDPSSSSYFIVLHGYVKRFRRKIIPFTVRRAGRRWKIYLQSLLVTQIPKFPLSYYRFKSSAFPTTLSHLNGNHQVSLSHRLVSYIALAYLLLLLLVYLPSPARQAADNRKHNSSFLSSPDQERMPPIDRANSVEGSPRVQREQIFEQMKRFGGRTLSKSRSLMSLSTYLMNNLSQNNSQSNQTMKDTTSDHK
jgi:hypothetical protein